MKHIIERTKSAGMPRPAQAGGVFDICAFLEPFFEGREIPCRAVDAPDLFTFKAQLKAA